MKTILITGASGGIGKECAKLFAAKGWNVVATMRSPETETEFSAFPNITVFPLDVTNDESVRNAVNATLEKFGQIDVLLNNAGFGAIGALESASFEDCYRQFDTNLFGVIRMIQAVLPSMRAQKSGLIINVSSIAEIVGSPFASLYHSSKWALSGLCESLQYELREYGIRIKLVLPPPVKTNFFGTSMSVLRKCETYNENLDKSFWLNAGLLEKVSIKPQQIAKIVYRAATDGRRKFRYNAGVGGFVRFFRRVLCDRVLFWVVRKSTL
ncbi:short-chain dehydrogenase/reductase [Bacteroidia bacterium]|nr:short-chain dehydrogenase/reductase [Bacteroidia bacterium]